MMEEGLSIDEVDAITGPAIGRPKSATFRLGDMVGVDLMAQMGRNLREMLKHDPLIGVFQPVEFHRGHGQARLVGREEGTGILSAGEDRQGARDSHAGLQDDGVSAAAEAEDGSRWRRPASWRIRPRAFGRCARRRIRAGVFAWKHLSSVLCYAAERLAEIADDVVTVDNAMKWGYNWELGPV